LLGYLGEVAPLAVAHRHLAVLALHVFVEVLDLGSCFAVDSLQNLSEAIIDGVDVVLTTVRDRE